MRRTQEESILDKVGTTFPLVFWTDCVHCGDKILWEKMWTWPRPPPGRGVLDCVCQQCASTKNIAFQKFADHLEKNNGS